MAKNLFLLTLALVPLFLSSPVNLQLPVEIQEMVSTHLSFKDAANFYASSKRISPSVLSYSKGPTVDDLLLIHNNTKMFELVLKHSKVTNQTLQSFFNEKMDWECIERVNKDVMKMLIKDPRIDPSASNNWAIRMASGNGHTEIVKLLLNDNRVDPSADKSYAIQMASAYGHTEIVKLLLNDNRVDPSADKNYAIRMASAYGHTEIVKLLLNDNRVDPSADKNYAPCLML
jgi:ankyrin repeat protein